MTLALVTLNTTVVRAAATDPVSLVKDINPEFYISPYFPEPYGLSSEPYGLTDVNGTLFFTADDGIHYRELWKSDGTAAGTVMVKDINTDLWSDPSSLTNINGTLYFKADDGVHGRNLWKSDGTATGTVMIKNTNITDILSNSRNLTEVNGTLFFISDDGIHGEELWKFDGTTAGAVMIKDINVGSPSSFYRWSHSLTNVNGTLYFRANDGIHGDELWKSDGTTAGTVMVKDINVGSQSSLYRWYDSFINANDTLYFRANDGIHGNELWKSDGTAAGTVMVKDINVGSDSSNFYSITNVNGILFFDGDGGLWKSDGTSAGTTLVKDVAIFVDYHRNIINVNDTLYFVIFVEHNGTYGEQLWKSDGTAAGTVLVKGTWHGKEDYALRDFASFNGNLYFSAYDPAHGYELWTSDGTAAGTVLAKDIYPGKGSSEIQALTISGSKLLFQASHPHTGIELWSVNPNENLLGNPGFEIGDTQYWHVADKTTASVVNDPINSGNNALALSGNPKRFTSVRQTITSAIVGSHRYNFKAQLAVAGNNTGKFLLEVRWYRANGNEYRTARTKFGITRRDTNFKLQTTELVAPPKAVRMVLYLRANKADGIAYFDDLRVTDLSLGNQQLPTNQAPSANIVNISPNPVAVDNDVSFSGHGTDANGSITSYQWRSNNDGILSTEASFNTTNLSENTHKIYFKVMNNQGLWSSEVSQSLVVGPTLNLGDNLLSNADFESSDTSDWTGTRTHAKVVTTPVHEGSYALSLSGSPTGTKKLSQSVKVTGGQTYRFQGWLSVAGNSTGKFLMLVRWYDASGTEISIAKRSFGISRIDSEYAEKVINLKAPSNAVSTSLLLKANKTNGVGYFDDISIKKLNY